MLEGLILLLRQTALEPHRLEEARARLRNRVLELDADICPDDLRHSMTVRRILAEPGEAGGVAGSGSSMASPPPLPLELWTREIGRWFHSDVNGHDSDLFRAILAQFDWLRCLVGLSRDYRVSIEADARECLSLLQEVSFLQVPLQSLVQARKERSALSILKQLVEHLPEWLTVDHEGLFSRDLETFFSVRNSLLGSLVRRRFFDALSAAEVVRKFGENHPIWADPTLAVEHLVRNPAHLTVNPNIQLTLEQALQLVSRNFMAFHFLPPKWSSHTTLVSRLLEMDPGYLPFIPGQTRRLPEIQEAFWKGVGDNPTALVWRTFLAPIERGDAERLVYTHPHALQHLHDFQADERLVEQAVLLDPTSFRFADPSLKQSRAFVLGLMPRRAEIFSSLCASLQEDPEILELARSHPDYYLKRIAESDNELLIEFAQRFGGDEAVLKQGLQISGRLLRWVPGLQSDRAAVMDALRTHGRALRHAPKFQNDPQVVLMAIQQDPSAIEFAGQSLRSDPAFAFAAATLSDHTFWFSSAINALEGFEELSHETGKARAYLQ
jgi:hypothetical protein